MYGTVAMPPARPVDDSPSGAVGSQQCKRSARSSLPSRGEHPACCRAVPPVVTYVRGQWAMGAGPHGCHHHRHCFHIQLICPPPVVHVLYDKVARQMNGLMISTGTWEKSYPWCLAISFVKDHIHNASSFFSFELQKGRPCMVRGCTASPMGFYFCI